VSGTHSPTVRGRRLALELRRLREAAKLTCEDVAARLECSASKISRIETGRVSASPRDVRDLLRIYDVPEDQHDSLIQLARQSRQKGWWHAYAPGVQPQLATYLGMESAASEIRFYSVTRIPALLQTESYARAVISASRLGTSYPVPTDWPVELLMERQRLAMANPPLLWVIMDEAAVRRQVGGRETTRRQLEHLVELSSMPTVLLQIIPFRRGEYAAMDLPFIVLGFPDQADPDVACAGYPTGMLWIEDTAEVDRYNLIFHHLQAAALSPAESVAVMVTMLNELRAEAGGPLPRVTGTFLGAATFPQLDTAPAVGLEPTT
jgi:transcriptional regulator with XRE-family HTH domain